MSDKKIPTLDTLFGGCNTETKGNNKIEMLETDTLFPYSEHPFLVKDNEDLKVLIQSIKDEGILIPLLVRVHPAMKGKFEILAGHRRHTVASSIGIKQVPMKAGFVNSSNVAGSYLNEVEGDISA